MTSPKPKRLLFLAYPFPPSPSIGAVRTWHIAKYLSRLGWTVDVVTPSPESAIDSAAVHEAEVLCHDENIKRIFAGSLSWKPRCSPLQQPITWLQYIPRALPYKLLGPFGLSSDECWLISCVRACATFKPGDYDIVLATGSPFSTFVAASRVAKRLKIPYVLDYRDPWSLSPQHQHIRRMAPFTRSLESRLIIGASNTIMVSPSQSKSQAESFNMSTPPTVITNGFDPDQVESVQSSKSDDFSVVYAGRFYDGTREIDPILKACKEATEHRGAATPTIRLHYYGDQTQYVKERAKIYGADDLVVCHGRVPRKQALSAIRGAGVVAVIAGIKETADLAEQGIITGKIFEPLGLGVPILLVAPDGSDATAIVEETGAGRSFTASQVDAMAQWLVALAGGQIQQLYDPPINYAWPTLAIRLDLMLCQAIEIYFETDSPPFGGARPSVLISKDIADFKI